MNRIVMTPAPGKSVAEEQDQSLALDSLSNSLAG
jgi:hypothetical protein